MSILISLNFSIRFLSSGLKRSESNKSRETFFFLVVRHKNIFAFVYRVEFFESSAANIFHRRYLVLGRPKSKLKEEIHTEYEKSRELVWKSPSLRLCSSSVCVFYGRWQRFDVHGSRSTHDLVSCKRRLASFPLRFFSSYWCKVKKQAELSSFSIFNLRDSLKDIPREKLCFDSGKKKWKIRLVLSNWSLLSVS